MNGVWLYICVIEMYIATMICSVCPGLDIIQVTVVADGLYDSVIDVLINIFIIWDYGKNMENKNFTVNTWSKFLCVGGNRSIILCKHT